MTLPLARASVTQDLAAARRNFQAGDLAKAMDAARRVAIADPGNSEAFGIWGVAAAELGAFEAAVEPLRVAAHRAAVGSDRWAMVNSQLGLALRNTGHWRQGLERLAQIERLAPADPIVRNRIGIALVSMNLAERGLPHLEWAVAVKPNSPDLLCDLGWALTSVGRLDDAELRFSEALALKPAMVRAHVALASMRQWTVNANHIDRLRALRGGSDIDAADRARLAFALFKELDDVGRYDEAWPVLEEAHTFIRANSPRWSATEDDEFTQALIRRFPPKAFAAPSSVPNGDRVPVFIVGLPRTGTTLVERILAAHSQVRRNGGAPVLPAAFPGRSRLPGKRAERTDGLGHERCQLGGGGRDLFGRNRVPDR